MSHRLSNPTINRQGNTIADCRECGPGVRTLQVLGQMVCKKGYEAKEALRRSQAREKAKVKKVRTAERKTIAKAKIKAIKTRQERAEWLWRQICYHRAEFRCELCGKLCEVGVFGPTALHAHHVVKRSQSKRLQLDPANSMAVCGPCHQGADRDQVRCLAVIAERDPATVAYLLSERRSIAKFDFEAQLKVLEETAKIYGIEG